MDIFVNALENYPIQSGIILIGLGIIYLVFRLDNQKKKVINQKILWGKFQLLIHGVSFVFYL